VLDDVAILSKVAAKKTAGVLGDDLALNAEQVSGVKAERELPVVWAVAKGSFLNKLILVPSALTISYFIPSLITYLLIIGGLYLCFEGFEKVLHKLTHKKGDASSDLLLQNAQDVDIKALEKAKIKGAILTDFVLSAEIIVIILGTVQTEPFVTQVTVLSLMSIVFTVGVYGFVALIVKIDDLGLYLLQSATVGRFNSLKSLSGRFLLRFAPLLMKGLTIVGTAAMFLVGGGIIAHGIPFLHHFVEASSALYNTNAISQLPAIGNIIGSLMVILLNGLIGIIAGGLSLGLFKLVAQFLPTTD
jgi:predicted DNA repair protein MutK